MVSSPEASNSALALLVTRVYRARNAISASCVSIRHEDSSNVSSVTATGTLLLAISTWALVALVCTTQLGPIVSYALLATTATLELDVQIRVKDAGARWRSHLTISVQHASRRELIIMHAISAQLVTKAAIANVAQTDTLAIH